MLSTDCMGRLPSTLAPVILKGADGPRELVRLTWGMPTSAERIKEKAYYGTTNIRHPTYRRWQQYVGVENRCLVPLRSFAEPSPTPGDKDPVTGIQRNYWFARDEARPLFFLAGVWTPGQVFVG